MKKEDYKRKAAACRIGSRQPLSFERMDSLNIGRVLDCVQVLGMVLAVNAPFLQGSLQLLAFLCLLAKRNIVHAGVDCCTEGLCASLRSHGMRVDAGTYAQEHIDSRIIDELRNESGNYTASNKGKGGL